MLNFDIESFVRKYMTKRPESLLKADFEKYEKEMHERIDGKRMLVIGGAGTIGSNYAKAALRYFKPAAMYVVDIDENQLTELTRELRSAVSPEAEVGGEGRSGETRVVGHYEGAEPDLSRWRVTNGAEPYLKATFAAEDGDITATLVCKGLMLIVR